jgi:uncharacterized Ntn-hydrolase superfamily protein
MKIKPLSTLVLCLLAVNLSFAQDTFSIVALDSITGEVGSAGASCVDMDNFPNYADDFLGELFPGLGAINTQAWYEEENQANARARMKLGDTPEQIIQWLIENDVTGQPERRQYGIVAMVEGSPESAAHTGEATNNEKGHITGPNYSIQGNILLGQEILDSMEARFLRAEGDLACKLMAAMQGANVVGADTRCAGNGTSSLFAFLKVAQPIDTFGSPSLLVSLRTKFGDGIEPIDSLQMLFDLVHPCPSVGVATPGAKEIYFDIYPNPCADAVNIRYQIPDTRYPIPVTRHTSRVTSIDLYSTAGNKIRQLIDGNHAPGEYEIDINVSDLPDGMYFIRFRSGQHVTMKKLIVLKNN